MDERPRPQVTVTDPARPDVRFVAAPLEDDERAPSPHRRRWLALVGALVLVAAAVLVARDVAEQRRLDQVVDVTLAGPLLPTSSWSYDRSSDTATLVAFLRLRNGGPRPVRVVSARLGELRFEGNAPMEASTGTVVVALARTLRCPADGSRPPTEPEATDALVEVVTPAGRREVVVQTGPAVAPSRLGAAGACGYPPLDDAVRLSGSVVTGADAEGRLRVRVEVTHSSRRRAQLVSLAFGRGLETVALEGAALPVPLGRPTLGSTASVAVDVQLRINCGAFNATGGVQLGDLDALVEDLDEEDLALVTGRLDDGPALRQAVRRRCSSG